MQDASYLRSQAELCLQIARTLSDRKAARISALGLRSMAWRSGNVTLPLGGSRVDWFDATGRAFAADSCLRLKGTTNRLRLVSPER